MKLEDIKMMYDEVSHIEAMLNEYLDTLEWGEWANFNDVLGPQKKRFDWIIATLDEELRNWD